MNKKIPQIILLILCLGYLFTRVYQLLLLPIFEDETIYIYWAKVITTTHSQWFISLTDGKPPLLVWLIGIFLTVLPQHLFLLAGRLPSVMAGLLSMFAIYGIGKELFKSERVGLLSAFLYLIFPFALVYDKLALFDSLLSSMLLCSTYFMIRASKKLSYSHASAWGFFLGLAFLSKPTAVLFVPLLSLSFLILAPWEIVKKEWKKVFGILLLSGAIAELINNLQRVSSVYSAAAVKNAQFQQPIAELLKDPFTLTLGNLNGFFSWMSGYYTSIFFIIVLFSLITVLCLQWKKGVVLMMLWLIPVLALATIGREIFPRYIFFVTPYSLIAFAACVHYLLETKYKFLFGIGAFLILLPLLRFDYYLLTDPVKAPLPSNDYQQLVSDSPSGYGVQGVIEYLNEQKKNEPIVLVTQGTFGLYPYAFTLEYWNDPRVTIVPRWPLDSVDQDIIEMGKVTPVYILLKRDKTGNVPSNFPVEVVLTSQKPSGIYPLVLTRLKGKN